MGPGLEISRCSFLSEEGHREALDYLIGMDVSCTRYIRCGLTCEQFLGEENVGMKSREKFGGPQH